MSYGLREISHDNCSFATLRMVARLCAQRICLLTLASCARRWCGPSISSSIPALTAKRSRSRRCLMSTLDESLLNVVERSITADRLIEELRSCFAVAGGPPMVLRMDNGPELISQELQQYCAGKVGLSYIPPGTPWNNAYIESFNNRLRRECLNRNHWTTLLEARVVIGDFKQDHNHRHRHSALGYLTPVEYAARCRHAHHPVTCDMNS